MDKEYLNFINSQIELPYYKEINYFLKQEISKNKIVFPSKEDIFKSFEKTSFDKMKVIILGQDPYHSKGFADGLAFSTKSTKTPQSLLNIFKELKNEYPNISNASNSLANWAKQGVLLLNACLSVEEGKPNSHSKIGWNIFIQNFINYLNDNKEFLIFVLWGNKAQELKPFISNKFYILESAHPSPFSASRGFFGNNHFKKINELLINHNFQEIDWSS